MQIEPVSTFQVSQLTLSNSVPTALTGFINPLKGVTIRALDANTGIIYVGGPNVSTTVGFPLEQGVAQFFQIATPANLYCIAASNDDKIAVLVE